MTSFQQTPLALKPEIWEKLRQGVNVSAVSDIMHGRGLHNQVMRHDIQALDPSASICGLARTMSSEPRVNAPDPGREYELLFAAIDGINPGEVLVTDRADCCVWGSFAPKRLCAVVAMAQLSTASPGIAPKSVVWDSRCSVAAGT